MNWRDYTTLVLYLTIWVLIHMLMYSGPTLTTKELLIMQMKTVDRSGNSSSIGFTNGPNRVRAKRSQTPEPFWLKRTKATGKAEPIVLLLTNNFGQSKKWDERLTQIPNTSTMYVQNCPHKCRYSFDRLKYMKTADLVIAPTFQWNHYDQLKKLRASM